MTCTCASARHRVVVVDDNADFATTVATGLRLRGFAAQPAFAAEEALALAASFRPQSMVIDIAMPNTSGWSLARLVRGLGLADAPRMIAVSALDQPVHRVRSFAAGFALHLPKPVQIAVIADALG